ncbi:MAG: hypothetical protein LPH21_09360 [Shewanella sp.]|nr:hypothetical protein [Shewanella sp.]
MAKATGVSLQLNMARELTRATALIEATPAQMTKAAQRAMKKTIKWLKGRIAREVAQQLGIPQKAFKHRLTSSTSGAGLEQVHILWFGLAPLAAEMLGNPRQTRSGVTVGKRKWQGAFYRDVYGDGDAVWIRKRRAEALGLDLPSWSGRSTKRRSTWIEDPENAGRFPVMRVAVDMESVGYEIFRRYERRAADRFGTLLEQELNYAVNVEGR